MNNPITSRIKISALIIGCMLTLCACGTQSQSAYKSSVDFGQLEQTGSMNLEYAEGFSVDYYGDYSLISVGSEDQYLVVKQGQDIPYNLDQGTVVLTQPLDRTYLVSTSVYDVLRQIGATDNLCLSGTRENDWHIAEAREAMQDGRFVYAGKYSAPDYELILSKGCNLAIENSMILHSPEAKEKLEELGIPVFIEKSSYETDPRGRLEWIKLYGLLYDRETEADEYFESQVERIEEVIADSSTNLKVAVFSINTSKNVTVRKPGDYISKMIEMAGGRYAIENIAVEEENALSTMNMQIEDFYLWAKDADIMIYNSTIEGEIFSIDELVAKNELLSECKAVREGRVYCTTSNFFQESTGMADFIEDIHCVLNNSDRKLKYLNLLEGN